MNPIRPIRAAFSSRNSTNATLVAVLVSLAPAVPSASHAGDWSLSVTPYVWATDVGVAVDADGHEIVDETIPVSDLLDVLDTIAQIRLEGRYKSFGLALDFFDVNLSDALRDRALPHEVGQADVNLQMGLTILDVAGFYIVGEGRNALSILCGARVIEERATFDAVIEPAWQEPGAAQSYETEEALVDGLLGLRVSHRFSRHWSTQMQADLTTGDTDYTWSAAPTLRCTFGSMDRYTASAGYRHMAVNFASEHGIDSAMTLSGFQVGFGMTF